MSSEVVRTAVVGAGFMGGGIAAELALRVPSLERVTLWDASPGAAQRAVERARDVARTLVDAGAVAAPDAEARLSRLVAATTLEDAVAGAAYVAEAVPEDLPLKQ